MPPRAAASSISADCCSSARTASLPSASRSLRRARAWEMPADRREGYSEDSGGPGVEGGHGGCRHSRDGALA